MVPSLLMLFAESPLTLDGHTCCCSTDHFLLVLGARLQCSAHRAQTFSVEAQTKPTDTHRSLPLRRARLLCGRFRCWHMPLNENKNTACQCVCVNRKRGNLLLLFYIRFRKGCLDQANALGFLLFINVTIGDLKSTFA